MNDFAVDHQANIIYSLPCTCTYRYMYIHLCPSNMSHKLLNTGNGCERQRQTHCSNYSRCTHFVNKLQEIFTCWFGRIAYELLVTVIYISTYHYRFLSYFVNGQKMQLLSPQDVRLCYAEYIYETQRHCGEFI